MNRNEKIVLDLYKSIIVRSNIQSKRLDNRKLALSAEVGIFWIDGKEVYGVGDDLKNCDVQTMNVKGKPVEIYSYGDDHYSVWKKVVRINKKWRGKEYEDVPRGRIAGLKDKNGLKFIVYASPECKKAEREILSYFGLTRSRVEFDYTDAHYQIPNW